MLQYHFNWKTISVAAGMTWWNFYFQIFEKSIGKEEVVEFLMHLLQHLSGPLLIIWDRASSSPQPVSSRIRTLLGRRN